MLRLTRFGLVLLAALTIFLLHATLLDDRDSHSHSPHGPPSSPLVHRDAHTAHHEQERSQPPAAGHLAVRNHQEPLAVPEPPLPHPLASSNQQVDYPLEVDDRGMVVYDPEAQMHPIEALIARAKKQYEAITARIESVKWLNDAVTDYEAAYEMKPPLGFDKWFSYVASNKGVRAASMYPMAHKPFEQFLSITAKDLRGRIAEYGQKVQMYTLTFVPDGEGDVGTQCDEDGSWLPKDGATRGRGRVQVTGPEAWTWRCNNTLSLMLPILAKFPTEFFNAEPPLSIMFNTDDGPRGMVPNEFSERSAVFAKAGKTWPEAQLRAAEQSMQHTFGWQWTCPDDSPLKQSSISSVLNDGDASSSIVGGKKSFIADFYKSTDVCYNPELREMHAAHLDDSRFANNPLMPYISVSRTLRNTDITMVPLDAQYQDVAKVKWESKSHDRVFWRGSTTGLSQKKTTSWRQSQRQRLHWFANNNTEATADVLIQRPGQDTPAAVESWPVKQMNAKWFDIGLAGGPHQCSQADGTCDEVRDSVDWKEIVRGSAALLYKYVVDVDGNAWSSRFRRLLKGNNVVLKSTVYPEWFSDLVIPWYHYVPVRADYGDMYDIMAFFTGAPDGSTSGRDDLAKQIAGQAHDLINTHWRVEDMRSYVMLVFLEYYRMMQDDRKAASFVAGQ